MPRQRSLFGRRRLRGGQPLDLNMPVTGWLALGLCLAIGAFELLAWVVTR